MLPCYSRDIMVSIVGAFGFFTVETHATLISVYLRSTVSFHFAVLWTKPTAFCTAQAVRAEVEAAMKNPFHSDDESISIPAGSTASLSLQLLPFAPGEYK